MVKSSDGGIHRRGKPQTYETVSFDCEHCRRRSIGILKESTRSGITRTAIHCGHCDCGKTTPWARTPQGWGARGGLTARQAQGKKHTNS